MTLLLSLGLTLGCLGCAQTSQSTKPAPVEEPAPTPSASAPTKRSPHAATLVALAVCREQQAGKDGVGPAIKNEFYDQACEAYRQAIKVDPEHMPAYDGLARIYARKNQHAKALEVYHQALQKKPLEASLWCDIGMCHCRAKQWELAIRSLEKGLELDKNNRRIAMTLGFCLARAGRDKDAVETLSQIMTPAEANYNVARMMRHMLRDDQCRHYLREAVKLDGDLTAAKSMLDALESGAANPRESSQPSLVQIGFE